MGKDGCVGGLNPLSMVRENQPPARFNELHMRYLVLQFDRAELAQGVGCHPFDPHHGPNLLQAVDDGKFADRLISQLCSVSENALSSVRLDLSQSGMEDTGRRGNEGGSGSSLAGS